jgi:antitoxin component YwqK of YwqJK toxin-antitoxin module
MNVYFNNTILLENTLLPYFCDPNPLILLNRKFSQLNYKKYNTHIQPHGLIETYHRKTKMLQDKYNYKNSKKDGLYESWYISEIWKRMNYKNNELHGSYQIYHQNGQIANKCWYKNGKLDGLRENWYSNGQLWDRMNYINGELNGLYEEWFATGKLLRKCIYKDDKKDGLYEQWWNTGLLWKKCWYKNEEIDNTYDVWYNDRIYWKSSKCKLRINCKSITVFIFFVFIIYYSMLPTARFSTIF